MREIYHTSHTSVVPLVVSGEGRKHGQRTPHFFEAVHQEFEGGCPFPFPPLKPNRSSSLGQKICWLANTRG